MPLPHPWRALDEFHNPGVPKLHNLKRAARAGFAVPQTHWAWAEALEANPPTSLPPELPDAPCIVRSGSPTEDTRVTSNAGQLLSAVVDEPEDFANAVARVVAALPRQNGQPLGLVFVQPLIQAKTAGVTFFDGFYFEETSAAGSNAALTAGLDRGKVRRGHVERGDLRAAWLGRLVKLVGGPVDVEWAIPFGWETPNEPMLLQARPALFPIRRNETISLANHKEILGDPPSPWMVGLLAEVARPVMGFFEAVDPEVATWGEPYAIERGERAWMNFAAFFRLMDHWGLPRTMVTEGVGGESGGPLDARVDFGRVARNLPTLLRKAAGDYRAMFAIKKGLKGLDADLAGARTLVDLWDVNTRALAFSIRVNFAVNSLLAIASKVRRKLGLAQAGRVVTHEMMAAYASLAAKADPAERLAGLDAWLAEYGHRGPLESDPAQPRFLELRETLRDSLARGASPASKPAARPPWLVAAVARFFFVYDEVREWFRDRLMWWWQGLRARILEEAGAAVEAGHLAAVDDVFFLRGEDLLADPSTWRSRVEIRRVAWEAAKGLDLPGTASKDAVDAAIAHARGDESAHLDCFKGIGLGSKVVAGTAVKVTTLKALLEGPDPPADAILVAAALEPSWAVAFPRFAAVVVDLGGELSHASILLREAGISAVVNARGAYRSIREGDRLVVDPARGEVRIGSE
jgi:pyruvate,water dikinase